MNIFIFINYTYIRIYIYKTVSNNHASTQSHNDDKLQEGRWTIFCEDPNKYIGKGYKNFEDRDFNVYERKFLDVKSKIIALAF